MKSSISNVLSTTIKVSKIFLQLTLIMFSLFKILNYIQSDSINNKKRERDKNDVETLSKNRKCYNCDSMKHLSNKCFNFHVFEHVFVD